ncbi:MAG: ATPase, T2SS/T4P/T4SS family, partial [Candidatus Altiarchaeota archaeon]|nr:ATPase, T2SS/T4P/T4SS family [Candidatus Altiarchaeota archaeon]
MCPDIIDSYGNIKIMEAEKGKIPVYLCMTPELTEPEKKVITEARNLIGNYKDIITELGKIHSSSGKEYFLRNYLKSRVDGKNIRPENLDYVVSSVMDEIFLGYGKLGPMMRDENLEEIMVNGINTPVFVVHRKHGMCTTNIYFDNYEAINDIVNWLAHYAGREINEQNPLLDAHMPDGSRANVAVTPAAPYGPAITI